MAESSSEIGWQARSVLHRYCRAIDHHDASALGDVFSDDVVLVVEGQSVEGGEDQPLSFAGRATVVQILSSLFEQRRWSRHFVSNELVEDRDDDEVEVRSYFQFVLGKEEGRVIGVGDYRAVMRPVDGSLRICEFSASIVDEVEVPSTTLDA